MRPALIRRRLCVRAPSGHIIRAAVLRLLLIVDFQYFSTVVDSDISLFIPDECCLLRISMFTHMHAVLVTRTYLAR